MLAAFAHDELVERCASCGGSHFDPRDETAHVVECRSCGHRFVTPRPSQLQIAAAYSAPDFYDGWIEDDSGRMQMWRGRLAQAQRVGVSGHVLDIGAGIGTFLALGRDAGWTVTGTELSISAARIASERYGLDLRLGQFEDLEFADNAFDAVTMWHVLEHVPNPGATLNQCRRVLRPNGTLIVAVPNDSDARIRLSHGLSRAARLAGRHRREWPRYVALAPGAEIHLTHFTPTTIRSLLEYRGFDVERVSVDDHHPQRRPSNRAKVAVSRLLGRVGVHISEAIMVAARAA